jgi:hypothetical protein
LSYWCKGAGLHSRRRRLLERSAVRVRTCGRSSSPAEQARIVQLLVERVDVARDRLIVSLRVDGLRSLVDELRGRQMAARRAA